MAAREDLNLNGMINRRIYRKTWVLPVLPVLPVHPKIKMRDVLYPLVMSK
jgi:hypothetical protein